MKPQSLLSDQIERIADSMAYFIETTPADVLTWRPELPGSAGSRTILEMAAECVSVNTGLIAKFAGEHPSLEQPVLADGPEASRQILASAHQLAETIRALPDEGIMADYPHHTGGQFSGLFLIMGAYRNMAYHSGQINLIQMLKGDPEFHRPQSWYGAARVSG